jgi:protein phosphatase
LVDALKESIAAANQQLRDAVEANPALEGMGTTLTAMLFSGNRIGLVHVGDSRAYVLRDGELTQLTRDDTFVQMLVDEGRITADEATTHPQRSLLTRALDGRDVDPEFSVREARAGDRYLLCSDGLSGVVSAETMAEALAIAEPREAADRLIALALRGGGPDNITCIVADIVDAERGDDAPVVGGAAARDRGRASSASSDSAAGRAALARGAGPVEDDEEDDDPEPPSHPVRTALFAVLALVLLAGTAFLGWQYTQSQYYVGKTDDGYVAVFRGVRGSLGGIHLSAVAQRSDLRTDNLQSVVKRQVEQGIPARSRGDAQNIVRRLQDKRVDCPPVTPGVSPTATPTASSSRLPAARPSTQPPVKSSAATRPATPRPTVAPTPVATVPVTPAPTASADCATGPR